MTMRPKGADEEHTVAIDCTMLLYLKQRDDPVEIIVTYEIPRNLLEDPGDELSDFMQIALQQILATVDVVREHRMIFSDRRFNKFVFLTDEVQGVSIMAPDEDTILAALQEVEQDG